MSRRPFFLACLLLAALTGLGMAVRLAAAPSAGQPPLPTAVLDAPGGPLVVELARTDEEQRRGLSDRPALARGRGMLFPYDAPGRYPFWMKDMRFPLDLVYLRDGLLVQTFADVPPPAAGEAPRTVVPEAPADAVLEVPAGEAARRGWTVGTRVFAPKTP